MHHTHITIFIHLLSTIVTTRSQATMADANADNATLAILVAAAVQQVLEAQAQQAADGPVQFARSPALAQTNLLDYTTAAGAKIFSKGTEALPTTFTLNQPNVKVLLNELRTRTGTFGWADQMKVNIASPATAKGGPVIPSYHNILAKHGSITMDHVKRSTNAYINTNVRATQNNYQVYLCLTNSVCDDTKKRMSNKEHRYMLGAGNDIPCGIAYLKILLMKAEVDT